MGIGRSSISGLARRQCRTKHRKSFSTLRWPSRTRSRLSDGAQRPDVKWDSASDYNRHEPRAMLERAGWQGSGGLWHSENATFSSACSAGLDDAGSLPTSSSDFRGRIPDAVMNAGQNKGTGPGTSPGATRPSGKGLTQTPASTYYARLAGHRGSCCLGFF